MASPKKRRRKRMGTTPSPVEEATPAPVEETPVLELPKPKAKPKKRKGFFDKGVD